MTETKKVEIAYDVYIDNDDLPSLAKAINQYGAEVAGNGDVTVMLRYAVPTKHVDAFIKAVEEDENTKSPFELNSVEVLDEEVA